MGGLKVPKRLNRAHTQRTNHGFTNERIVAGLTRIVDALGKD